MSKNHTVLLDCGAFSAHRQNRSINLWEYIDFIHRHGSLFSEYANLDMIPKGGSHHDAEEAAQTSWEALELMRRANLSPMPVYHAGERRYWLERILGEGFTRIGLGGLAMKRDAERRQWMDEVFAYLQTRPNPISVHLFGVTSLPLLFRYPAATADSTTWNMQPGLAVIPIPLHGFGEPPVMVGVGRADKGVHLNKMGPNARKVFDQWLAKSEFTLEEVIGPTTPARRTLSIRYFKGLSGHRTNHSHPVGGLFSTRTVLKTDRVPRLFLGISCVRDLRALETEDWLDYLVSYDYLVRFPTLWDYVRERL